MEVLTDVEGNVGILLSNKEATILKFLMQIDHTRGQGYVEEKTEYTAADAAYMEQDLWEKLSSAI